MGLNKVMLRHRWKRHVLTAFCLKKTNQFEIQQLLPNKILLTTSLRGSGQIQGTIITTLLCKMKMNSLNSKARQGHAQELCEESVHQLLMQQQKRIHWQLTVITKKLSISETI